MNKTNIEWVKNPDYTGIPRRDAKGRFQYQGYTWNPITGCLNHDNGLCKGGGFPCYAYKLAHGRLKQGYLANRNIAPLENELAYKVRFRNGTTAFDDPFYPRFWEDRLQELVISNTRKHTPRGIFPCDMGELFGDWLPDEWTARVLDVIKGCRQDRFYLLTKQPQNLIKWSPFPDNCWVGVTATNVRMFVDAMNALLDVEAKIKFLSLEPLLEWHIEDWVLEGDFKAQQLDWVIIGAQTKPYKPPRIEWVQEIVEIAGKAGIPVFEKNNLAPMKRNFHLSDFAYLRQEMPK